jgi:NADPH:quinone reductase
VSMFPSESAENFRELLEMIERGAFTPRVTEVFPLARYAEAFRTLGERRAKGKVVLTVG